MIQGATRPSRRARLPAAFRPATRRGELRLARLGFLARQQPLELLDNGNLAAEAAERLRQR